MPRLSSCLGLLVVGTLALGSIGCPKPVPPSQAVQGKEKENLLKTAMDRLRGAEDSEQFRAGFSPLNDHLTRTDSAVKALTQPDKELLKGAGGLTAEEMAEVEAVRFRPLDAHYLEMCFSLRKAAQALTMYETDFTPLAQAEQGFHWVMRHVALREQEDDFPPPHLVLRLGMGNARDRALLFLALLQQLDIDGCILSFPQEKEERLLAGACLGKEGKLSLYLFDPLLGTPLAGPQGQGIATLEEARKSPELLEAAGIKADWAKMEVRAICPLTALAPRMKFLETELESLAIDPIKVKLALEPSLLLKRLAEASGTEVRIWNPPTQADGKSTSSPTRSLRHFFPPEEGGVDKTSRWLLFKDQAIPSSFFRVQYYRYRLEEGFPAPALKGLVKLAETCFEQFALQPRHMLLQGQIDKTEGRLSPIEDALEQEQDDPHIPEVEAWKNQVRKADLAGAKGKFEALFSGDQFLGMLLNPERETRPALDLKKTILSRLVLFSCRGPLGHQVRYLRALCFQEKAEKEQALVHHLLSKGKVAENTKVRARVFWEEAENRWNRIRARHPLKPFGILKDLETFPPFPRPDQSKLVLDLLELMNQDITRVLHGRLQLVRTLKFQDGKNNETQFVLEETGADLKDLLENGELRKELAVSRDRIRSFLTPQGRARLDQLARAWEPGGTLFWQRAACLYRLKKSW